MDSGSGAPTRRAVIVGSGVVGLCCALFLQRDGHAVTLVDPGEARDSTAKWSCGLLAVGEIIPLSKPGIFRKVPGWLLDRQGPLSLRPAALPGLLPWFMRFLANARPEAVQGIATALASLTRTVFQDYQTLLGEQALRELISSQPVLHLFATPEAARHEAEYNDLRRRLGFDSSALDAAALACLEPSLAGRFGHAIALPQWRYVKDTVGFLEALQACFVSEGGQHVKARCTGFDEHQGRAVAVRLDNGQALAADTVVVAAGARSSAFFRQLGVRIPLRPVAGYQALIRNSGTTLRHALIHDEGGFCLTPMARGLQVGGTIEFVQDCDSPDLRRAQVILDKVRRLMPELDTRDVEFGVGYRPLLPDTKPVIDRCRRLPNVYLALGHGQLGLTLGATTGRLIGDLAAQRAPDVDLSAFSAYRY